MLKMSLSGGKRTKKERTHPQRRVSLEDEVWGVVVLGEAEELRTQCVGRVVFCPYQIKYP
jgi:3'-phosphoadenosine 5'-phosphosulfate sulfotransferase